MIARVWGLGTVLTDGVLVCCSTTSLEDSDVGVSDAKLLITVACGTALRFGGKAISTLTYGGRMRTSKRVQSTSTTIL